MSWNRVNGDGRTEELVLADAHFGIDLVENRRLVECAFALSARHEFRTAGDRLLDPRADACRLGFPHQRSDLGAIGRRIADRQRLDFRLECVEKSPADLL